MIYCVKRKFPFWHWENVQSGAWFNKENAHSQLNGKTLDALCLVFCIGIIFFSRLDFYAKVSKWLAQNFPNWLNEINYKMIIVVSFFLMLIHYYRFCQCHTQFQSYSSHLMTKCRTQKFSKHAFEDQCNKCSRNPTKLKLNLFPSRKECDACTHSMKSEFYFNFAYFLL